MRVGAEVVRRVVSAVLGFGLAGLCALAPGASADAAGLTGIHKIKHVVMIMQENRSL